MQLKERLRDVQEVAKYESLYFRREDVRLQEMLRDFKEELCTFKRGCVMYESMGVCMTRGEDVRRYFREKLCRCATSTLIYDMIICIIRGEVG